MNNEEERVVTEQCDPECGALYNLIFEKNKCDSQFCLAVNRSLIFLSYAKNIPIDQSTFRTNPSLHAVPPFYTVDDSFWTWGCFASQMSFRATHLLAHQIKSLSLHHLSERAERQRVWVFSTERDDVESTVCLLPVLSGHGGVGELTVIVILCVTYTMPSFDQPTHV